MGFFFWKKKQEPQSTEGEISPPPSDSSLNPSPENKDRKTQKAERYFNKGLEFLNSTSYKDRALQQFINAGNLGYIDAIHYIGLCYFKGYGTPSNPERAVEIWQKNVLKKNPLTQYMLGYCYFHGIGIERNRIVARAYLKTAEALGNTDASKLLKEDIPSQASSASANYQPSVTATQTNSTQAYKSGFLKITTDDGRYDIQYENAKTTILKRNDGYYFTAKSTIKQNASDLSLEVKQVRDAWKNANVLLYHNSDNYQIRTGVKTNLRNISQTVELICGKKIFGIPSEITLNQLKVWTNENPTNEIVLPTEYAEYQNVTDEYARAVFFLVEALITDNPIKGKYFQSGRENLVRLSNDGNSGARELLSSFPILEKQQFIYSQQNIQTARNILDSLSPESRYQIFFAGANCGSSRAKVALGKCYREGIGVKADRKKAEFWISAAAQSGNAEAKSLLNDTAEDDYREGLLYYLGEKTGRKNRSRALDYFSIAKSHGSKYAAFILETEHQELYIYLEAAKYGSRKAKEKVIELHNKGEFTGKIPKEKLNQYFIDANISSDNFLSSYEMYRRGLSYYVGEIDGRENVNRAIEYFNLARKNGSKDAKKVLDSAYTREYVYLEAAKYGSLKAKEKIIEYDRKGLFDGKIPSDSLKKYFDEIGIESVVHPKTTEEPTSQKTVDELYKDGLAYFVGDKTGRENTKEGTDLIFKASLQGSKEASFIFKTNDPYTYIFLEAAKYGSERARKRVIEWNKTGFLNKIPQKRRQEYFSAIGITEVSQAIPNEQKKSLAKDAVTKKDTAKPAPKEKQPKSTPKKPKKQEKIVIDKERLQEVKAEHLYIQNRLAIDYGDDEPSVIPVSVPLTLETPAKAEAGGEWEQMRRALSKTHIQIISALLEEPGNITKQHDIAKSEGTMLDILYDEINEISDEILGDLLIDEGELVEEYIEDVKSLCQ